MSPEKSKIFVVDDDPAFSKAVSKTLKANGYQVVEESRMLVLIKSIVEENPDLILLDLCMPKAGGVEIIKTMWEMKINVPILIISGQIKMEDFRILRNFGVTEFLVKPFTMNALLAKVKEVLKPDIPEWVFKSNAQTE
ncbi:MAG TPA: response regulator [archaeon]|nr:response regulator [archaeon]